MDLTRFLNKNDKAIFENKIFKTIAISLALSNILLAYFLVSKVEEQRVVVMPPFLTLKEFWVSGNNVSDTYLEMVADGVAYNVLNLSPERKPNTEFLFSLTPPEFYNQVKGAIEEQIKFIQNNGVNQVFYTTGYNLSEKGHIRVTGILKQYIGEKKMDSSVKNLEIYYFVKGGRFWIKGIDLKNDGQRVTNNEDEK